MTVNKSNHSSFMSINYKQKMSDLKLFIMLIIFNLMAFPYLYIMLLNHQNTIGSSIVISFIAYVFIFGCGVLIPLLKFPYLNQRSKVDMIYALPLSRRQLFFSDYFSGLTLYLVPYLLQMLLVQLLPLLFPLPKTEDSFSHYYYRTSVNLYNHKQMFLFMLIVLFMMLFLYTLTVFIISCTGNLFEAITASLYCNILIPLFFWTIESNIFGSLYSISSISILMRILERTSPIGGLAYLADNYGHITYGSLASFLFPYFLIILVLFYFSMRIQTRRKAEEVSVPFVIRAFYYTVLTILLFIIGTFLFKSSLGYLNLVIILTILFFLIELITNRGIHRLRRSFLSYAITMTSLILFLVIYTKTNGFGIVYRTSSPENLNSIKFEYDGIISTHGYMRNNMEYTEKENIEKILNLQKRLLTKYNEHPDSNNDNLFEQYEEATRNAENGTPYDFMGDYLQYIYMGFDVKNGIDYSRYYYSDFNDLITVASLEISDEFIDYLLYFYQNTDHLNISDIYQTTVLTLNENKKVIINGLLKALCEDMKEISLEDFLSPKESTGMMITLFDGLTIVVNPKYTRTIKYMKENSLWIDSAATNYNSLLTISDVFLVTPNAVHSSSEYYYSTYNQLSYLSECPITELTEDVKTLFTQAQYKYVTTEPCYYLVTDKYRYVIPPEYTDVAQRVFEEFHVK